MSDDDTKAELKQTLANMCKIKERFELELETQATLCQAVTDWFESGRRLSASLEQHGKAMLHSINQWNAITATLRERLDADDDWWKGNE